MKAEVPVHEQPPPGSHPATFVDIEEGEGEYGPYWRWFFEVDVEGDTIEFVALSSAKLGSRSKGGRWLKGLRGGPSEPGELVDFDDLRGTECEVVIEENDEGFARLTSVLPAKKKGKVEKINPSRAKETERPRRSMNLDDDLPDPF